MILRTLFSLTMLLLISACASKNTPVSNIGAHDSHSATVIVIGAGMAGLSAASRLQKEGYEVIVLEAKDRIGGRTFTSDQLGPPLDLGAGWLHGVDNNPLFELAESMQFSTTETNYERMAIYNSDGELESDALSTYEEYYRQLIAAIDDEDPGQSVNDVARNEVDPMFNGRLSEAQRRYLMAIYVESDYAADVEELDVGAQHEGAPYKGEDRLLNGGYIQLVNHFAKDLRIERNTAVTGIDYEQLPIRVSTNRGEFLAQKVLVTVPLGVLQAGTIRFNPTLPKQKAEAINAFGMGLMNKLYLKFDTLFWDTEFDLASYQSATNGMWNSWFDLSDMTSSPILLAINTASEARELERLNDEETVDSAMKVLKTMYGNNIPQPTAYIITRWGQDPHTLGSYSFVKVGSTSKMRRELAKSVDNRVFFAGEATESTFPETAHGAHLSGEREARKIMKSLP